MKWQRIGPESAEQVSHSQGPQRFPNEAQEILNQEESQPALQADGQPETLQDNDLL